ncbi:MAG TPA: bifunctional diaminohydroxyphosphoribosylaminopyrimidine deaminase/5-amino-6-(5-phosphoribosylamino)uracil reductase RibD, partial [Thermoanaerobaculia bacterium]|nr:bifunctional diaminohydroxyphosphoribosylaminopyrimidine deaminase/5-amino-6-(5-phosphoribosylamino)uracil reductase RibD [Thermoanaerobaculia bacterium]
MSDAVPADAEHLARTLRLAARGRWGTAPNPMVGCRLVAGGEVVGEGHHAEAGGPHAEVAALAAAAERARGATAYVSLEPCAHHGRTPPCADALLDAGVARVVAIHRDPDPRVSGGGFARLAAAGVEVATAAEVGAGELVERALRLNLRYLVPSVLGRPLVSLKWASSLDGKIATRTLDSRWISSPEGRRWSLALREEHDAILVGSGTALADDPRLDRRLGLAHGPRGGAILRVVLDRRLRLPATAKLLAVPGPVLVYTEGGNAARRGALEAATEAESEADLEVVELPEVTPEAVVADLHRRSVGSLLVEGGGEIHAAFVAAGLFDRVLASLAPLVVGGREAPGPVGGKGPALLADAVRLEPFTVRRRGP